MKVTAYRGYVEIEYEGKVIKLDLKYDEDICKAFRYAKLMKLEFLPDRKIKVRR